MSADKFWKGAEGDYTGYVNSGIIASIQAENDRLKAELADSLPLGKVREMVEYCDAHRGDCENYDCYVSCPFQKLCEFLGDLTSCKDDDTVSILEKYVKEVRGE